MKKRLVEKLEILADAAKYDVSCSSSGSKRDNKQKGLGNTKGMGICHSYTPDGRCVSLLKILLTNHCIFDCAYCVSRKSNDVKRAAFTVEEVVELTINFYRRNYIEGLFLSSGIFHSADATMERLVRIAKCLRNDHGFNGYIHLKAIPGASQELIHEAGVYADRLSINLELPSELSLKKLAPEKSFSEAYKPMDQVKETWQELNAPHQARRTDSKLWLPAGQSTQLVVGASPETDNQILELSQSLYQQQQLKRVYYSAYVPVGDSQRLFGLQAVPMLREHRLYQADFLMRLYGFQAGELTNAAMPNLELALDPKMQFALLNRSLFPVEVATASKELLLRIPGIGIRAANRIVEVRKYARLDFQLLKKLGVVTKRAMYFILCGGKRLVSLEKSNQYLKNRFMLAQEPTAAGQQLALFSPLAKAS